MFFLPSKRLGLVIGLIILLSLGAISIFLLRSLISQEPGMSAYVTGLLLCVAIPLLGLWAYWYYGLISLRYYLDRNVIVIIKGVTRHIVPLEAIKEVRWGREISAEESFRGVGWPGYLSGVTRVEGLGDVLINSTEPLERQLIIVTEQACYGISPAEPESFLDELAAHRSAGALRRVPQSTATLPFAASPLWHDRRFWLTFGAAFVLDVVLFGLVSGRYQALPNELILTSGAEPRAFRAMPKAQVYIVPTIGAVLLAVNALLGILFYTRERFAAYLLAIATLVVQLPLVTTIVGILSW